MAKERVQPCPGDSTGTRTPKSQTRNETATAPGESQAPAGDGFRRPQAQPPAGEPERSALCRGELAIYSRFGASTWVFVSTENCLYLENSWMLVQCWRWVAASTTADLRHPRLLSSCRCTGAYRTSLDSFCNPTSVMGDFRPAMMCVDGAGVRIDASHALPFDGIIAAAKLQH